MLCHTLHLSLRPCSALRAPRSALERGFVMPKDEVTVRRLRSGEELRAGLRQLYADIGAFSRGLLPRYALRAYQLEPARAIVDSVLHRRGRQFALVFARQAGKDETLAQLLAFLLNVHQRAGGSIVVAAP